MGMLTECEIFDCLETNFRLAAEHCEDLARKPRKGPTYRQFREELQLIEGACRQAAAWRSDSRWLRIGMFMGHAHRVAGEWLRGIKARNGQRVKLAEGQMHPLFMKLAENLRSGQKRAQEFRDRATGVVGRPILPEVLPGPHRETRPVGYTKTSGGLFVPSGVAVQ